MKISTLALAALLTGFALHTPAQAGTLTEKAIEKAEKNYLACLNSGNEGVVTTAIAEVVRLRLALPNRPMESIGHRLAELTVNGETAAIRYRAYLAGAALENPRLIPAAVAASASGNDDLFALIAARLQATLLGYAQH